MTNHRADYSHLTPLWQSLQRTFLVPLHPSGQPRPSTAILTGADLCSFLLLNDLPRNRKWSKCSYSVCRPDADEWVLEVQPSVSLGQPSALGLGLPEAQRHEPQSQHGLAPTTASAPGEQGLQQTHFKWA